jgi:hypothetical protein
MKEGEKMNRVKLTNTQSIRGCYYFFRTKRKKATPPRNYPFPFCVFFFFSPHNKQKVNVFVVVA